MGQEGILIGVASALWLAGWVLARRVRGGVRTAGATTLAPEQLSLIIPARNEAHNLPQLLASIREQPHLPREVIVVDDGSDDDTAAVARAGGARVIASAPLPDDWRGKPWACHQGAAEASAPHLMFLDADTWFEPGGLELLLTQYEGGALSAGPYHRVRRPHEQLSAFFNLSMVAGTVPGGLFGQSLLVPREAYERVGGHARVRDKVLENFHLARLFRDELGLEVRGLPGRGMLDFRMYPNGLADLVEGWTKGFAGGAGRTPKPALALVIAWFSGLMLPLAALPLAPALAGWLYLAFALQALVVLRGVGSFSPLTALLYPLPLGFYFAIFARSVRRSGKTVTWKGREIRAD